MLSVGMHWCCLFAGLAIGMSSSADAKANLMIVQARRHLSGALEFRALTAALGVIWLLNAAFQAEAWLVAPSAESNLLQAFAKPAAQAPAWLKPPLLDVLHGVQAIGPGIVAAVMVAIAVLLGLALMTRVALKFACGLGIFYNLVCWLVLGGLGFPYAHGQTDPGVFPAYVLTFVFVLAARPYLQDAAGDRRGGGRTLWARARIAFGLLWLFDAALKWLPAFLFHFTAQITSAIPGQPHWIALWLGFVAMAIGVIGPVVVAVLVAVAETAIAVGLLSGRWLRIVLPFGILYSLAVWSTAEAFGGPYTLAGTGVRGNVIGNVIVYVIAFLFLWAWQRARSRASAGSARSCAQGSDC